MPPIRRNRSTNGIRFCRYVTLAFAVAALLIPAGATLGQRRGSSRHGGRGIGHGGSGHRIGIGRRGIQRGGAGRRGGLRHGGQGRSGAGVRRFRLRGIVRRGGFRQHRTGQSGPRHLRGFGVRGSQHRSPRHQLGTGHRGDHHDNSTHLGGLNSLGLGRIGFGHLRHRRGPRLHHQSTYLDYGFNRYGYYNSYGVGYGYGLGPAIIYSESAEGARDRSSVDGDNQAESLLSYGRRQLKEGEYHLAAEALLDAVLGAPEEGVPKLLFGHANFAIGDYDYAAYAITRAMDGIDDLEAVPLRVTDVYRDSGEFDRLLYKLHDHVRKHAFDAEAHFLMGYFRYFAGKHDSALRSLNEALQFDLNHRHAKALREIVRAKIRSAKKKQAIRPKRIDVVPGNSDD